MNVKEIKDLKSYLVEEYHKNRIRQQEDDESFVNDSMPIEYLPDEVASMKTGKAYRMVSSPAEHIITSNPQIFREPVTNADIEPAKRIAKEANRWLKILSLQNPNPFKEHVKKTLGQGEGWIYLVPNDNYDKQLVMDIPVEFLILDPKIVFIDGWAGETNGVPSRVIICYDRIAENIKRTYPQWKWEKQGSKKLSDKVPYFMYIDNDIRYTEADDEALLLDDKGRPYNGDGIQENYYGFVPMVHSYAGFGSHSADGDPASLCISRITHCRDLIKEYTAIRSVINYLIFQYAQPPLDYEYDPSGGFTPPPDFANKYDRSPKALNMVPVTPGSKGMVKGVDMLPDQQLFLHLYNIENQIDEEDPLGQVGQVMGSSGRQQIDAKEASLRRYDSVVENTTHAFQTAFGLAFKMCDARPSLYPKGLNKNDLKNNYSFKLMLKAEDPVAAQITRADGDRKYAAGIIDWETNLTQYQGYTQDDAQKIMDKRIVDDVILNDPIVKRLIGLQIAQEMGMGEQYQAVEQMMSGQGGISQVPDYGSQGGPPRQGNIQTQTGREQTDMSLAQRPGRRPVA